VCPFAQINTCTHITTAKILGAEVEFSGNFVLIYQNILIMQDYVPENTERVSEFDPPPSPTDSYGWVMPDDKEMSKDPPIVPPQLPNGFLGSHYSDEEDFPRPQHIVLNHLFIERGLVAQPIVALGLTHRFQSKYVTVVLYKPVER
jgi:5'-AMP-activated protein kinase, regulatory beta subunit